MNIPEKFYQDWYQKMKNYFPFIYQYIYNVWHDEERKKKDSLASPEDIETRLYQDLCSYFYLAWEKMKHYLSNCPLQEKDWEQAYYQNLILKLSIGEMALFLWPSQNGATQSDTISLLQKSARECGQRAEKELKELSQKRVFINYEGKAVYKKIFFNSREDRIKGEEILC